MKALSESSLVYTDILDILTTSLESVKSEDGDIEEKAVSITITYDDALTFAKLISEARHYHHGTVEIRVDLTEGKLHESDCIFPATVIFHTQSNT